MILVVTVGTIGVDCHYVAGGAVTLETGSLGGWGIGCPRISLRSETEAKRSETF